MRSWLRYYSNTSNVVKVLNGFTFAAKWLMLYKLQPSRIEGESIPCNTCTRLVGTAESSIDYQELSACHKGFFSLNGLNGYVSIDYVTIRPFYAKVCENACDSLSIIAVLIVVAFVLFVGIFILDEVAFEGGHGTLIEEGRVGSTP